MDVITNKEKTCTFIGHRRINKTEELVSKVTSIFEQLIYEKGYDTFLIGSRSEFNDMCTEILSGLKKKYPHIRRIYIRAEYPVITEEYRDYLLGFCDDTYYPSALTGAGKAVYVERNRKMLDKCSVCIFYFHPGCTSSRSKSGTALALEYAKYKEVVCLMV